MIAALLLAAACTPDPAYRGTPTLAVDPPACLGGSLCGQMVAPVGEFCAPACYPERGRPAGTVWYWQRPAVAYDTQRRMVHPSRELSGDSGELTGRYYPGLSLPYAVQKFNASQLEPINFAVAWYWGDPTTANESGKSNTVTVCMPALCKKPGPCN